MPGINLTRDEAAQRSKTLSVQGYQIELDLSAAQTEGVTTFGSTTVIRFTATEPGTSTFVDLIADSVQELTLNGVALDPAHAFVDSRIELTDLAADNELRVVATCRYSRTGEGLHRSVDPSDGNVYLYTQFEVPDARRVFATFEQPDLKARFDLTVIAPAHWQVVSNSPTPEPVPAESADPAVPAARWQFPTTPVMSTYLTALIAGPYHVVRDTYTGKYGSIPLGVFCRQSLAQYLDADDILLITKQGFEFFEDLFAMGYPFAKYDQLFVPEYNMGAMENIGAVTFRDDMVFRSRATEARYEARSNTILHEMSHMWFGDLVTMKWWDDLWLNESFAEWASHHADSRATRFRDAWTTFCNQRKNWAYRQDQLPSTHPIATDMVDLEAVTVNFDGITYAKGASALRQLVAWVGEEEFIAGLRSYFAKHAWSNTTLADLLVELEAASGRDLSQWTAEWLRTAGVNTMRADFDLDADGAYTRFEVVQTAHPDWPTLRSHRLGIGLYQTGPDGLTRARRLEIDVVGERTPVPELVGVAQPDLLLLNDGDLSYTKIRLDERSQASLVEHIADLSDSLARALCWSAAWDMTRDAQMRAGDFVRLVLRGVGTETDLTAVQTLLQYGLTALWSYTHPTNVDALVREWDDRLRALAESAEAGSDHQLAFAHIYAASVTDPQAADVLAGWLDGSLPGLTVDSDMRWALVTGLARLGRFGEDEIAAELRNDDTVTGAQNAAAARASRPTAEAKAWAWDTAVVRQDVPNETQRSVCRAFWQPRQEELLEPYVDSYLAEAPPVWKRMGPQLATTMLVGLFPRHGGDQVLAKVDAFLAEAELGDATRRYVAEGRADLARAMAAREFDGSGRADG
jgi:aminopeptidase N